MLPFFLRQLFDRKGSLEFSIENDSYAFKSEINVNASNFPVLSEEEHFFCEVFESCNHKKVL